MAKVFKTKIDRFNGGMVGDPRDPREAVCRGTSNMDLFSYPYKIRPRFASESGDDSAATSQKQNFAIAKDGSGDYNLYSLGKQSANSRAEVLRKIITTTGATNDLGDDGWATPSNNQSSTGAAKFDLFTYYEKVGLIFCAKTNDIMAFSPTGTAWDERASTTQISFTTVREGLVHSVDDILYIPYDNNIAKNDNGSWTNVACAVSANERIEAICEYGNFIAIATTSLSNQSVKSNVYLWDRDTSLTIFSEKHSWGNEKLLFIEELGGFLVGASTKAGVVTALDDYVSFRYLTSSGPKEFQRFPVSSINLPNMRRKANGRIYFQMYGTVDGTLRDGIWSINPTDSGFAVTQEYTPNNTTALTTGIPSGFYILNDFVFQSYIDNSTWALSKTNESEAYTTGVYETTINPQMPADHRDGEKQLLSARVSYEKLASGDTVVMYYRVDGGAWVEIGTASIDDSLYFEKTAPGTDPNFVAGSEYEFKLESTGGAVITAFTYKYSLIDTEV